MDCVKNISWLALLFYALRSVLEPQKELATTDEKAIDGFHDCMECSFMLHCTCFCLEGLTGSPMHFAKLPISALLRVDRAD